MGAGRNVRLAGAMLLALAAGFIAYVARLQEITHDAFHEMALVREGLVRGALPQQDLFAYTPTVSPSVHHEWATGAVLYWVTVGSGLGVMGLTLLKLVLIGCMWYCLYRVARLRGAHPVLFACMAFVTFPVLWVGFATIRAQLFTLVFIAAQLWMQELDWRGRRGWLLLWLPMLVAWLNLHAGFVVGLGMMAFHGGERTVHAWADGKRLAAPWQATWHLWLAAPAAGLALLINPYGWQYIPYLVRAITMPRPLIAEWKPLWHTYAPIWTLTFFAISVGLFIYTQRHVRIRRLRGAAFLAVSCYMALKHIRHGSIYAVVWMAYVPAWLSRTNLGKSLVNWFERRSDLTVLLSRGATAATLLFAVLHQFWLPTLPGSPLSAGVYYPTGAVDYLRQANFQGNLLTPFYAGAYVSWELYPHVKVSLDGRYEVAYQSHVMSDHKQFSEGQGRWWELLDKYPTQVAMIDRQWPVYQQLKSALVAAESANSPWPSRDSWRVVYEDDAYLLIARAGVSLPYVERLGYPLPDQAWEAFSEAHAHWHPRNRIAEPAESVRYIVHDSL